MAARLAAEIVAQRFEPNAEESCRARGEIYIWPRAGQVGGHADNGYPASGRCASDASFKTRRELVLAYSPEGTLATVQET